MDVALKTTNSFSRSKKSSEPRPSRTLLLFEAILTALEERIRLSASRKTSPPLIVSSLTSSFSNDENTHSSWLACLQAQFESVTQLHQRYNWVLSQRQNASARESQLLFGNSDSSQLAGSSSGERRRTMASTLQAIRADMARLDGELFATELRLEETLLGWLECGIHGLAGFARLSPGSLFRLTLKHANQKWESRIVTGKHNKQFIENDTHRFQIVLDYSLGIKAEEERSLGQGTGSLSSSSSGSSISSDSFFRSLVPRALFPRRLIGTVNFDILPLINALPQLLTISLNTSGSIKLHIIVKWLPPPPPPAPASKMAADQLALELRTQLALDDVRTMNSNGSSNSSGAATFAARSGRRFTAFSFKNSKGSRTVRQHKSMSLNPQDVGALLSQLAIEDVHDSEAGLTSDPSVVSSVSPIPSLLGSSSLTTDRHSSWSWLRNTSPRSELDVEGGSTLSRTMQPPPGAGMDRIRALALHDLNSCADAPRPSPHASSDAKILPTIIEPESTASVIVGKESTSSSENFSPADLVTSESLLKSISAVLGELRGRFPEIGEFEQAFANLRSYLVLISNSHPPEMSGKSKSLATVPLRSASVRQSIRKRKNHQDLQVNVEPSGRQHSNNSPQMTPVKPLARSVVADAVASTCWPELDAAISSHLGRSFEDLQRLATVSFLPMEVGNHARQTVVESLKCHTIAIRQVITPLLSADPSERPILATDITASMLPSADSNSLWSALSRSPSGLIALPAATLHAELTKRVSAFRSRGPATTYGHSPTTVADRALAKITHYYGEYVHGSTLSSITKLASTSNVVTLCDFAFFAGVHSPGVISRLEEVNDEVKLCHCLEPAIVRRSSAVNDDSMYASVLQATRRAPSPVLVHGLAGAATGSNRGAISAAFRSSPVEWCHSLVNCIGCILVWIAATDSPTKQASENINIRLAFISLLQLLSSSTNFGADSQLPEVIASVLAHLAAHDSDPTVRGSARNATISLGKVGLSILAKSDRSANAFQGIGVTSVIYNTSDQESVDEI